MKKILFTLLLITSKNYAQSPYQSHSFYSDYIELKSPTQINKSIWNSDSIYQINVPFNFKLYNGKFINSVTVAPGNGIFLDTNSTQIDFWYKLLVFQNPIFGPLLIDRGFNGKVTMSPISYQMDGLTSDRIFKIQWINAGFNLDYNSYSWNNPTYNDSISFQIWLYEKNGNIEIHFGPSEVVNPFSYGSKDGFTGFTGPCPVFLIGDSVIRIFGNPGSPNYEWIANYESAFPNPLLGNPSNGMVYQFVNIKLQRITFELLNNKKLGDPPFELTAYSSSGLSISYSSSNTDIASINGNIVTIHNAGRTNITATQNGNDEYLPASPITQTLLVIDSLKSDQFITFDHLPVMSLGDPPFELTTYSSSGLPISYSNSNTSVASLDGRIITIKDGGESDITAYQDGNEYYNPANPVTQKLIVIEETGIIKKENKPFLIFPNPSQGKFALKLLNERPYDILIIDLFGKVIYKNSNNKFDIFQIDLSNCISGVYFLKVYNDYESLVKKIIIE